MTDTKVDPFDVVVDEIRGVPTRVFANAYRTLRDVWDASAAFGRNEFLVYDDERWTFDEAHEQVRALAHRLSEEYGVGRGDRVAIAMRNYPEWALSFWATEALGAVAVPLNAWWTGHELEYGLRDSGAKVLFADEERIERVGLHLAGTDIEVAVAVRAAPCGDDRCVAWDDALRTEAPPLPELSLHPDDDATIMYTSGTTGKPKGAVATHRNLCNFLVHAQYRTAVLLGGGSQPASSVSPAAPAQPAATLLTFPLFHVGGLQSFLLPYTLGGGKIVLMYKWDASAAVELVDREQITAVAGVPTTMFQLLDEATARGTELRSLAGVSAGATLVPPELVRRIDDQLASRAAPGNGYGLTETSGAAVANFGPGYVDKPDSVGKVMSPVIDVKIVDPDGADVESGEVGEIWIKGPTVVRGYFGLPEETAASFTDGWFHTGDLGRFDADADLHVLDRMKDVVIRGGENVYAAEVEAALYEHAQVAEAAVIGVPHDRLGEEVGAVVRLRSGAGTTVDELREHVGERLATFKVPARVWLTDEELPRNAAGKVLKRELRESLGVTT